MLLASVPCHSISAVDRDMYHLIVIPVRGEDLMIIFAEIEC